jgi:hypothetical protein
MVIMDDMELPVFVKISRQSRFIRGFLVFLHKLIVHLLIY